MSEREMIGCYRVQRLLGQGGMGQVYLCEDPRLGRQVAIKVLGEKALASEEARRRFEREARTAAQITHPNIVHIYEVGEDQGMAYIVMEYVEGRTLRELIAEGALTPEQILRLAEGIADGLAAAHERGIIHRDIKATNILVDNSGRPRILDFGLAKALDVNGEEREHQDEDRSTISQITQARKVMGTVAYMSPEQAAGKPLDHRSDIFSFGVVLYQMASGHLPFEGDSDITVLVAILRDTPASLAAWRPNAPPELERIIFRCLEKRPDDRYQTTSELREDLKALSRDADWEIRRSEVTERLRALNLPTGSRPRTGPTPRTGTARPAEPRANRAASIAAALAAGMLFLGALALLGEYWKREPARSVRVAGSPSAESAERALAPESAEAAEEAEAAEMAELSEAQEPGRPRAPVAPLLPGQPQLGKLPQETWEEWGRRMEEMGSIIEHTVRSKLKETGNDEATDADWNDGSDEEHEARVLAVLGFRNHTGDASLEWVSSGLPEIIITDLGDLPNLRLVGTRRMSDLAARAGASWEKGLPPKVGWRLAESAGADLLLTGSLFKTADGKLRLDASLEDVEEGTVVHSEKQVGTDIFALTEALTKSLRAKLGGAPVHPEMPAVSAQKTTSEPAMALFTQAMAKFNHLEAGEAIPLLEKAVQIDPNFLLARLRLLQSYRQEGRRADVRAQIAYLQERKNQLSPKYRELVELYDADEHMSIERSLAAVERLEPFVREDPEMGIVVCRLRARIGKMLGDEAQMKDGLGCLQKIYSKDPQYAPAAQAYALALESTGRRPQALKVMEDYTKARPEDGRMRTIYAQVLQNEGKLDDAVVELKHVVEQRPQDSQVLSALTELYRRLQRFDEAEQWANRLLEGGSGPAQVKAAMHEVQLQSARGHIEAALEVMHRGTKAARKSGDDVSALRLSLLGAELLLATNRPVEAWKLAEKATAAAPMKPDSVVTLDVGIYARAAGQEERADQLHAQTMRGLRGREAERIAPHFEKYMALADATKEGDFEAAAALCDEFQRSEPEFLYFPLLRLALENGENEWLVKLLKAHLAKVTDPSDPFRILAYYFLGRAHEAEDRPQEALTAYREFLHWWKDGDAQIAEIADAKARVDVLQKKCIEKGLADCEASAETSEKHPT